MQRNSIIVLLNSFANEPRLGKNEMFCDTGNNLKKGELHELFQVVLAAPATQVSVERAFSGLKSF